MPELETTTLPIGARRSIATEKLYNRRPVASFLSLRRPVLLIVVAMAVGLLIASCGSSPSAPSAADSLVSNGLQAESDGQYQQAQRDFVSAAAQERSAIPYYDLGVLYQRDLHDPVQAAVEYKRALSIQPKNKNAMFNLAVVDTRKSASSCGERLQPASTAVPEGRPGLFQPGRPPDSTESADARPPALEEGHFARPGAGQAGAGWNHAVVATPKTMIGRNAGSLPAS